MIPGPNLVYKCPNCGNFLINGSLMSGNTFGAVLYSDGKRVAPMLPEFPDLTKCKKCNTFFWLSKIKVFEKEDWFDIDNSQWEGVDSAEFLEIEDYFNAINQGAFENKDEELLIRQRIWWSYNDRIRDGLDIFNDKSDELRWTENIQILKTLLDPSDINQRIMIAEINRNIGDFETCIKIIQSIDNDELNWLKEKIVDECNKKNKWVIEL